MIYHQTECVENLRT